MTRRLKIKWIEDENQIKFLCLVLRNGHNCLVLSTVILNMWTGYMSYISLLKIKWLEDWKSND